MSVAIHLRTAAFSLSLAVAAIVLTSGPAEAQTNARRGQLVPWGQPQWVNPQIYRGVRTADPFRGTTVRQSPLPPNYPGGQRGRWYNPYGTGRDNNVVRPSPNGRSRYMYDPNWRNRLR
jgi:hypothetical protein